MDDSSFLRPIIASGVLVLSACSMPDATFDARPGVGGQAGADAEAEAEVPLDASKDVGPDLAHDVTQDQQSDVSVDQAGDVTPDSSEDVLDEDASPDVSAEDVAPDVAPPDAPPDVPSDVPCLSPLESCGGQCVDTQTSPQHCGGCNKPCPSPPNALASCANSVCSFTCEDGFKNCDNLDVTGCEAVSTSKSYKEEVLADAPIGYWRLGDSAGSTVADSSGSSLPLTVHAPLSFGQPGALYCDADKAMRFVHADGGWLGHARTTSLEPVAALSFELWMQQTGGPTNYEKPIWYGDASKLPWGSWGLQRDATSPSRFAFLIATDNTTGTNWLTSSSFKQKDTWYHVVATYDGAMQKLYVNGVLDVQNPATGGIRYPADNFGLAVGACDGQCSVFTGMIDEVAVYDKALGSDRIAAHYAAGKL